MVKSRHGFYQTIHVEGTYYDKKCRCTLPSDSISDEELNMNYGDIKKKFYSRPKLDK